MSVYSGENTTPHQYLIDLRLQLEFIIKVINENPEMEHEPLTHGYLRDYLEDIVQDLP